MNTPLTPTVAPVHDMRTENERTVEGKPLWLKILLIAGAIAILVEDCCGTPSSRICTEALGPGRAVTTIS